MLGVSDSATTEKNDESRNKLNTVIFYLNQIMLNCSDPDVTVAEVKRFLQYVEGSDEMLRNGLTDNSAARDEQLAQGVLMRLNRVRSVLSVSKALFSDPTKQIDAIALRAACSAEVVAAKEEHSSSVTAAETTTAQKSVNILGDGAFPLSNNGELSEMDRLRIISQVAFNFL